MKKILLVGILALGLLLLATFALAADTTTTATAKDTATSTAPIKCCDHNYVDANHDGKCDICGMALEDTAKFNTGNSGQGCGGNCSGHKDMH
jgi:hypothetical protein